MENQRTTKETPNLPESFVVVACVPYGQTLSPKEQRVRLGDYLGYPLFIDIDKRVTLGVWEGTEPEYGVRLEDDNLEVFRLCWHWQQMAYFEAHKAIDDYVGYIIYPDRVEDLGSLQFSKDKPAGDYTRLTDDSGQVWYCYGK